MDVKLTSWKKKKVGVDHLLKSIAYLANMVFMQDGTPRDKNGK